jgi:sugar-specific transcriptional regulator TrmB
MTNKQDLIKKVKYHFDLNIYESKVWVALLSKNVASVGEIAELSGVPRSRVYDVLESLEKKGFAIAKLGKPVKFIAVKPTIVLDRLKNNLMREADERIKTLETARATQEYKELETLFTKGIVPVNVEELTSAVKGRSNIYSYMKEIIGNAEKEVFLITTQNALRRKAHFLKPLFDKLKTSGVSINVAAPDNGDFKSLINLSRQLGVQVKKTKINARFCVVDNSKMLIMITPESDDESDIAVTINSPFFGRAISGFMPLAQ